MKKLLDKSLRPLIIYALLVLVITIPVYFLIIDLIWENELDKHHYAIREKLEKRLTQLQLSDSAVYQLINDLDKIQPGFSFNRVQNPSPDSLYTIIRFDTFMNDREQFRCLVTDIRVNDQLYRVLIETNMEEVDETILAIAAVSFLSILLLLAGFIYLNRRTAITVWKPFYNTLSNLHNFRLENGKPLPFHSTDVQEFSDLNSSLDNLIQGSLSSYRVQKEFVENASHELQTPLSIVKTKLDMLLQSKSLDAEQMALLEETYQAINRVTRINKNLLLLAKIEHSQFEEIGNISINTVLSHFKNQFEDQIEAKSIQYSEKLSELYVQANPVLVDILMTNLLVNAIRYTTINGRIDVLLANNILQISNTGSEKLQVQNLFRRFSQASSQHVGSGLGLAISKEICSRYGWNIQYDHQNEMHIFSIHF